MGNFFSDFLSNDSAFGRFMNKAWIIIVSNILFMFCTLPVVTIGPGLVALYHVMLKTLRLKGDVKPAREFWNGLKSNFKQALILWILALLLALVFYIEIAFCQQVGGFLTVFKYGLYMMAFLALIIFLYTLPVMAAFADTLPHLFRNAFFFAAQKPFNLIIILFFDIFPLYLTYSDPTYMPLYGFVWCTCGFGLLAMLGATLLLPQFRPFLDKDLETMDGISEEDREMDDLRKLDGL